MAKQQRVGELRPSQLMFTFGVGALIDLPYLSAVVMGLDDWPLDPSVAPTISEERLLRMVRWQVGEQVERLVAPPAAADSSGPINPFSLAALTGVPVATFPRWLVCPRCELLAPLSTGLFELKHDPFHPERTRYIHSNCSRAKQPTAVPARFVVACPNGHLDDFPWVSFVHRGQSCANARLRLIEFSPTGEARALEVRCDSCGAARRMSEAFGDAAKLSMPTCRGRRPHLRDFAEEGCTCKVVTMLLGATNLWFPEVFTTLAIPTAITQLDRLVEAHWANLQRVQTMQNIDLLRQFGQLGDFIGYSDPEIWQALERRRTQERESNQDDNPADLKTPEWTILSQPDTIGLWPASSEDLRLRRVAVPEGFDPFLAKVVLVERLREVRALIGFTRIDAPSDLDNDPAQEVSKRANLARRPSTWVPATEVRGEGIFIQFNEAALQAWLNRCAATSFAAQFEQAHRNWRRVRGIVPEEANYPELRYVLLHSFAHALMRQVTLECGYTAASVRERIYSRAPNETPEQPEPMAGVLIYTATPDSEGTLGGLVNLGEPEQLGRLLRLALRDAQRCASDPLCAEHPPSHDGITLHAAACHACLFAPETSCERGNRYLDRAVLAPTVEHETLSFFASSDL